MRRRRPQAPTRERVGHATVPTRTGSIPQPRGRGGPLGTADPGAASYPTGRGYAGPGFFVWDEDPRRARDWVLELLAAAPRKIRGDDAT